MFRHKKLIIIAAIIVSFTISGCAEMNVFQHKPSGNDLNLLIADQKYDLALQYLRSGSASQTISIKERDNLRKEVLKLINDYESIVEKNAAGMIVDDDLSAALTLTDKALKKIPSSIKLKILRAKIETRIEDHLKNKERELLTARAVYTLLQVELYGEQARLQKSYSTGWKINRLEKSLLSMHRELVECTKESLRENNLDAAKECLHLAAKIDPTGIVESLQTKLNEKTGRKAPRAGDKAKNGLYGGTKSKSGEAKGPAQQKLIKSLTTEIDSALTKKDFLTANAILHRMHELKGESKEVIIQRQKIEQATKDHVQYLLKQGNELYRNGSIAEAREVWINVLLLDPENQKAATHAKRAGKVLDRFQELTEGNGAK